MQAVVKGKRIEERKHLKIGVDLCSVDVRTPAHSGVTDNVSSHGARVLTSKALQSNERLNVRAEGGLYAVGLQLYASAGEWVSPK
jgi:hypothetical protein